MKRRLEEDSLRPKKRPRIETTRFGENLLVVGLQVDSPLCVIGVGQICALLGKVTVNGFALAPKFEAFASFPFSGCLTVTSEAVDALEIEERSIKGIDSDVWTFSKTLLKDFDAVVALKCRDGRISTSLADIWSSPCIAIPLSDCHQPFLRISPSWSSVSSAFSSTARQTALLCGQKVRLVPTLSKLAQGAGKSTLLRYLVNQILSQKGRKVAVFDLDVGQPEFSFPGVISMTVVKAPLLSPPHGHLEAFPEISRCFGGATPMLSPKLYLELIRTVWDEWQGTPGAEGFDVLVNTCGWTSGVGKELLELCVKLVSPSCVVQVGSLLDCALVEHSNIIFAEGKGSSTKASQQVTAVQRRHMRISCSLLPDLLGHSAGAVGALPAVGDRLRALPVVSVPLRNLTILFLYQSVEERMLGRALNGVFVYLARGGGDAGGTVRCLLTGLEDGSVLSSSVVGCALVQAVDMDRQVLLLRGSPAVAEALLRGGVDTVIRGPMELTAAYYTAVSLGGGGNDIEQTASAFDAPYLDAHGALLDATAGGRPLKSRHNLKRGSGSRSPSPGQ